MKKTPLKQKTPLKRKTPLKAYKSLKSRKGIKSGKKIRTRQKTAKKLPGPYHSIFTDDMGRCYITGDWNGVEPHHVFQGAEKTKSEKYGFILPLRSDWHRTGDYAIHKKKSFRVSYKMYCQDHYIHTLGRTKEEWKREFDKWWGVRDMVKEDTGVIEINEGMMVYRVFAFPDRKSVGVGVVERKEDGEGFRVFHKELARYEEYSVADIGRVVFLDRETALEAAENRQYEEDRKYREDFAEQNSRPFGKI